jgi:hypothetical protein
VLAISLLVLWPAHDRLDAWYVSEHARLLAFNCDRTAFYSVYAGPAQTLATWGLVTTLVLMIGGTFGSAGGSVGMVAAIMRAARREALRLPA